MSSNAGDAAKASRKPRSGDGRDGRPDVKLKEQVYKDERPAEYFRTYHDRVRDHEPEWIYEIVRWAITVVCVGVYRARSHHSENVPNGPVILAPNHGSFMDHFLCAAFIRRHVQFMGKSQYFRRGSLKTWVFNHGGVFPVRRGARDEDVFVTAETILRRGGCMAMYVEGGRTRTGELSEEAKPGMGRLALSTGATIVPVAIINSHRIRNWKRLSFPKISVHYGEPLAFTAVPEATRGQQQAVANEVLRRIRSLHDLHA